MTRDQLVLIGAGAWGTALAVAYARVYPTRLCARKSAVSEMHAAGTNARYLPNIDLPPELEIAEICQSSVSDASVVLVTTPVSAFESTLELLQCLPASVPVIWGCKGLHHQTGESLSSRAKAVLGCNRVLGALSGPSFAANVAKGDPTALTIATTSTRENTLELARFFSTDQIRCYASDDLVGVEIGGALKNIYAIASGVISGIGWNENSRAALLARALAEMLRFGEADGAKRETLMGLSGLGDLHLTCSSILSRNFQVGKLLASGERLGEILENLGHVAEGVETARLVGEKAKQMRVEMPIADAVLDVIDGACPVQSVAELMARKVRFET